MKRLVSLLTTRGGEINQHDFWIGAAVLFVAGLIANLIPYVGIGAAPLLLYPWTCLAMKRLRDMGRSEGLAAVPLLLGLCSIAPSVLAGIGLTVFPAFAGLLFSAGGLAGLIALGFLVWLALTSSRRIQSDPSDLTSRI